MILTYSKANKKIASLDSQIQVTVTNAHGVVRTFGEEVVEVANYDTEAKAVKALEKIVKHFDTTDFDTIIYLDSDPI